MLGVSSLVERVLQPVLCVRSWHLLRYGVFKVCGNCSIDIRDNTRRVVLWSPTPSLSTGCLVAPALSVIIMECTNLDYPVPTVANCKYAICSQIKNITCSIINPSTNSDFCFEYQQIQFLGHQIETLKQCGDCSLPQTKHKTQMLCSYNCGLTGHLLSSSATV